MRKNGVPSRRMPYDRPMTLSVDPRTFEHPYVPIPQLCFLFQMTRYQLTAHLKGMALEPARALNGEFFSPKPRSVLYAASDVVLALPPMAQRIFLAWQRGDVVLPPTTGNVQPPVLSAAKAAPGSGPRKAHLT
jgi:hypothetical protein